jgi:hypothetical protein
VHLTFLLLLPFGTAPYTIKPWYSMRLQYKTVKTLFTEIPVGIKTQTPEKRTDLSIKTISSVGKRNILAINDVIQLPVLYLARGSSILCRQNSTTYSGY